MRDICNLWLIKRSQLRGGSDPRRSRSIDDLIWHVQVHGAVFNDTILLDSYTLLA